jgi:hypothetical protein
MCSFRELKSEAFKGRETQAASSSERKMLNSGLARLHG